MAHLTSRAAVRPDHRRWLVAGVALAAAALFASTASAQESAGTPDAMVTASVAVATPDAVTNAASTAALPSPARVNMAGPRLQHGEVRYVPAAAREEKSMNANMVQRAPSRRGSVALLVVGLAAMIIGSEVDDAPGDLIVLGGAGMALYGIYGLVR